MAFPSDPLHTEESGPRFSAGFGERFARPVTHSLLSRPEELLRTFSPAERLLLYLLTALLGISALVLFVGLNSAASVTVPGTGGTLVEGVVGPARFINPVLAVSEADEDLTKLVYSGLTRTLPDGSIIPDLAELYDISPDGTTYTFTLREDAAFHDGAPVTAADVVFTVQSAQNPDVKSPRRADWEGVTVAAPDARTIVFTLPHAYAPFLENTALGILPKHVWGNVSPAEFPFDTLNTHPIGSGPYRVEHVKTNSTGAVTRYELVPFENFTLGAPFLSQIVFAFYPNMTELIEGLNSSEIDAVAAVPASELPAITRYDVVIFRVPLPRVFGVFFNQNRATLFTDASVRNALDTAVDGETLVRAIFGGGAAPLDGPIPPGVFEPAEVTSLPRVPAVLGASTSTVSEANIAEAREVLERGGWTYDERTNTWKKKKAVLSFSLATADTPELTQTADVLADTWRALGVTVTVQRYPLPELNTSVIRPRAYDAILFGEVVGRSLDLFAFWHSSQRNDPGLNLALYTNAKADALLAQGRAATDPRERKDLYRQFEAIVKKDKPAVFLYTPEFTYALPDSIKGVRLGALTTPSERFANVYEWYADTEKVWSIFTNTE